MEKTLMEFEINTYEDLEYFVSHLNYSFFTNKISCLKININIDNDKIDFSSLQRLETLDLSCTTWINNLPDSIYTLHNLKNLILHNVKIYNKKKNVKEFSLTNLEKLNISANRLTKIPDYITKLKKVKYLDISSNKSINNFSSLFKLTTLKTLRLCYTNIKFIPKEIKNLINLEILCLSNNKNITSLPKSICNLKELKSLNISHCSIKKIPLCIFNNLINLNILIISGNQIEYINSNIKNVKNLKTLFMSSNKLKKIPNSISSLNINNISLAHNLFNISDILKQFKNIKKEYVYSLR